MAAPPFLVSYAVTRKCTSKRELSIVASLSTLLSIKGVHYLLPVIAVVTLMFMYPISRKEWDKLSDVAKLVLMAILVRMVFMPFFMHVWDINTI
ncbi:MAG: hypothetical protein NXY59_10155 [Aigarchaeota archaeon]|nr:hypothetical protein [Candidatus Pelearchaeum maunauluense]